MGKGRRGVDMEGSTVARGRHGVLEGGRWWFGGTVWVREHIKMEEDSVWGMEGVVR